MPRNWIIYISLFSKTKIYSKNPDRDIVHHGFGVGITAGVYIELESYIGWINPWSIKLRIKNDVRAYK